MIGANKNSAAKRIVFYFVMAIILFVAVEILCQIAWKIIMHKFAVETGGEDISAFMTDDEHLGNLVAKSSCRDIDKIGLFDLSQSWREETTGWRLCGNADGFRAPDFSKEKPDGVYRIICMGDSSTMGYEVEADEAYCNRLQSHLEKLGCIKGKKIETISAGISTHSSFQGVVSYLKYVRRWQPDLVTLSYGADDRTSLLNSFRPVRDRNIYKLPDDNSRSSFYRLPKYGITRAIYLIRHLFDDNEPQSDIDYANETRSTPAEYAENMEFLINKIKADGHEVYLLDIAVKKKPFTDALESVAKKHGLPILHIDKLFDSEISAILDGRKYRKEKARLDTMLKPGYESPETWKSRYLSIDDIHPTFLGHEIIARELAKGICEKVSPK